MEADRVAACNDGFIAEIGWRTVEGVLYVNADDLIALLAEGGYTELSEDFARVAEEERQLVHVPQDYEPGKCNACGAPATQHDPELCDFHAWQEEVTA